MSVSKIEINHIGVSVKDINKAIEFYTTVMGWKHIAGPWPLKNDGGSTGITNTLYGRNGRKWTGFRLAHIIADNGVGLELLEFDGGKDTSADEEFDYMKHGIFHFAITVPDVKAFVKTVEEWGGEQYCDYNERPVHDEPTSTVYVKDPCGLIYEVHDHNYEFLNKMM